MQVTAISHRETAKMIRSALKSTFPNVNFSVRCSKVSREVVVNWSAGPRMQEVKAVADQYQGFDFDGTPRFAKVNGAYVDYDVTWIHYDRTR